MNLSAFRMSVCYCSRLIVFLGRSFFFEKNSFWDTRDELLCWRQSVMCLVSCRCFALLGHSWKMRISWLFFLLLTPNLLHSSYVQSTCQNGAVTLIDSQTRSSALHCCVNANHVILNPPLLNGRDNHKLGGWTSITDVRADNINHLVYKVPHNVNDQYVNASVVFYPRLPTGME